ncbi:MAG: polynucleotide kinase-phosphatase [Chitinophagaceae bacterium]|nr:polynucleotide kinase-phosphatase [Chitinophagaceae bacterium]
MSNDRQINVPELSLVVLIGASSSGKSSFARRHFKSTEIVSSDACRAMVSDDENSLAASGDAFDLARVIASKRLKNGLLTVIDATNVQENVRKDWIKLAREHHVLPVAIVINLSEKICAQRHATRTDRDFGKHVIPMQISQLKRSLRRLKLEGFRHIFELRTPEEVEAVTGIGRQPLYNNKREEKGPFDIIGDVHGCYDELTALLRQLGYEDSSGLWRHPEGRKPVFVGDLVDRGPDTPGVLRTVMSLVDAGLGWCVPGNHDVKLLKWLNGKNVQPTHGLQQSIEQLQAETPGFRESVKTFLDGLISHYVFDGGNLVVAHAGLREEMQGRGSGAVREFCLYGETTGETDEFDLPVRYNWAAEYKGKAQVVYGHTPVPEAQWLNRTIDIDTGCVFGGKLTALRYPERELVSVPAARVYCEPARPLHYQVQTQLSLQQQHDDVLDIADIMGRQIVETMHGHRITVREENAMAALEVMSRWAINPKWLIYLPPTMSPAETSKLEDYLEYPKEAFDYYRGVGVDKVVCEEKHMGSRAVIIVARDADVIERVFGIVNEGIGVVYTRTGRAFFQEEPMEQAFLQRLNNALEGSGFYRKFQTDWVCLDTELMPWSAKAQSLLVTQYGATGTAATHALEAVMARLQQAASRPADITPLLERFGTKPHLVSSFVQAYRRYCWPVKDLEGYKLAPFHILATEGKTWLDQDHEWHMENIRDLCAADTGLLLATPYKVIHLDEEDSLQQATDWWLGLTAAGGEGMVVKPYTFIHTNKRGLVQPAIKIRGKEYLRIIYGPEYTSPENMSRLKSRGLSGKRSLALREFALGIEGLQRFINREPLRRIHECVFAVLALESEPLDPRL